MINPEAPGVTRRLVALGGPLLLCAAAAQAQESARSAPPDLTPYVRPVIPADRQPERPPCAKRTRPRAGLRSAPRRRR